MIETMLLRRFTIGHPFAIKPLICDLALIMIIGAFGYFIKPKKQFRYFFIWMAIITATCIVNSIYYVFYTSFASFSLLAEIRFVGEVGDSVIEKFKVKDFIYLLFPIFYYFINKHLKNGSYFHFVNKVEKSKKMFVSTLLAGIIVLAFTLVNIDGTDASRLVKQWNREYIVQRFGIVLYQGNDLIQSLTPKINSLFGYDEAAKEFKDFFSKEWSEHEHKNNRYTGTLEGMNVIFVHMESIQGFLVDMELNGEEVTPALNKLTREGMYFSNFYPQISVGTSSDTEFTLNTSMMPVSSGTVFVSYYKRTFVSIPKLLGEQGYYTFSAHANNASMWNRNNMHPRLGYQEMYFKDTFDFDEKKDRVGLGLKDEEFFRQMGEKLEKIEDEHEHYMGTLIQLSNHSPFAATEQNPEIYEELGALDLTNTYTYTNPRTGAQEVKTDDYLKGTKLGNYLISVHYADLSLGKFLEYVENSDYYDNTIFVFYGDHDAKLDKSEFQYYYNYDKKTGVTYNEKDSEYVNYDYFANEINRKTPLIIWTKNKEKAALLKGVNNNVMGMYDILPTLGNMMGFYSPYALGHDIYDIGEDNVVVFPNSNFVTNTIYYSASANNYLTLKENAVIDEDYIKNLKDYSENILNVSNDIIIHDLIRKEGPNLMKEIEEEKVSEDGTKD
jgi:phosphoglycerol transferase MdoB-like AlkP superfamily enzyme